MRMIPFETIIIINPLYTETEAEQLCQEIGAKLQIHSDHPIACDFWGKKKLAYPIISHREGYYAMFNHCITEADVSHIHSYLDTRMKDKVIKYISVKDEFDEYWEKPDFKAMDLSNVIEPHEIRIT